MIINLVNKGKPIFGKVKLRVDESNIIYPNLNRLNKYLNLGKKKNILNGLKETIKYYKKILEIFNESNYFSWRPWYQTS